MVSLPLDEVSAKVRTGGPIDDDEDMDLPVWAGVLPLHLAAGALQPEGALPPPGYLSQPQRWSNG